MAWTETMNLRRPELRDRLASEYVLGTLHGRARARFQRLLRDDLELRDRVAFWERGLTPMAATLSDATPSAAVWEQIAKRIAPPAREPALKRGGFARLLSRWLEPRGLGSLAAGLLIGIAATLLAPTLLVTRTANMAGTQLPESYVGVLATADGRAGMVVSSLRHGKVIDAKQLAPVALPAGRVLYLWTIGADGSTQPVGPVPPGSFVQLSMSRSAEAMFSQARELAVSVEPAGSTPAAPGGPYVYRGLCGKLWRAEPTQ
jgi:anti-sigma-K factor RskA